MTINAQMMTDSVAIQSSGCTVLSYADASELGRQLEEIRLNRVGLERRTIYVNQVIIGDVLATFGLPVTSLSKHANGAEWITLGVGRDADTGNPLIQISCRTNQFIKVHRVIA